MFLGFGCLLLPLCSVSDISYCVYHSLPLCSSSWSCYFVSCSFAAVLYFVKVVRLPGFYFGVVCLWCHCLAPSLQSCSASKGSSPSVSCSASKGSLPLPLTRRRSSAQQHCLWIPILLFRRQLSRGFLYFRPPARSPEETCSRHQPCCFVSCSFISGHWKFILLILEILMWILKCIS